jgi:hypothetical protein
VRKDVAGIVVSSYALECSPYARKGTEETQKAGIGGIALSGITPGVGIEAEEELNILRESATDEVSAALVEMNLRPCCRSENRTYRRDRSL